MKRIFVRKYSYVLVFLLLAVSVAAACFLGGEGSSGGEEIRSAGAEETPMFLEDYVNLKETEADAGVSAGEVKESVVGVRNMGEKELAGVWVPYMTLTTEEKTQAAFEKNFREIAAAAKEKKLNALFVHVRPFCDALYPSEIYPWSHILTGEQGKDPGFDPLKFMVDCAHAEGLELHAWINPLRVSTGDTPAKLSEDNPYTALKADNPHYFMEYGGGVYLDPAYSYVRSMVADGAAEIAEKYEVDGIHFDDYFYPTSEESTDKEEYALYSESADVPMSLLEWRRANISAMVQEVYRKIKAVDESVEFGISPQGNIGNDERMGADVRAWCAVEGYIDYICPQLYFSFENEALGFSEALSEWAALPKHENLKLYAGLALYKAGTDADGGTWLPSDDNIGRQIEEARAAQASGVVLYSWDYLNMPETEQEVINAVAAIEG